MAKKTGRAANCRTLDLDNAAPASAALLSQTMDAGHASGAEPSFVLLQAQRDQLPTSRHKASKALSPFEMALERA